MINKISFTGREECLTGPIKKAQKPVVDYIADGAVLPEIAQKVKASAEDISSAKLNEAYRAAHAPYLEVSTPKVADEIVMDGQRIL